MLRIRSLSALTMAVFGAIALVLGAIGLLRPEALLANLNLIVLERGDRAAGDYTLAFITLSSIAAFNVGVYYVLAALTHWKAFFWWTVPFRCLTFAVFSLSVASGIAPDGLLLVGVWELIGALTTGGALLYERRRAGKAVVTQPRP